MKEIEQGLRFMKKYDEYLAWKQRRDELSPELREPEKKLKPKSSHYEGCPETGKIVIDASPQRVLHPYADPYLELEVWYCFECGSKKEV